MSSRHEDRPAFFYFLFYQEKYIYKNMQCKFSSNVVLNSDFESCLRENSKVAVFKFALQQRAILKFISNSMPDAGNRGLIGIESLFRKILNGFSCIELLKCKCAIVISLYIRDVYSCLLQLISK